MLQLELNTDAIRALTDATDPDELDAIFSLDRAQESSDWSFNTADNLSAVADHLTLLLRTDPAPVTVSGMPAGSQKIRVSLIVDACHASGGEVVGLDFSALIFWTLNGEHFTLHADVCDDMSLRLLFGGDTAAPAALKAVAAVTSVVNHLNADLAATITASWSLAG